MIVKVLTKKRKLDSSQGFRERGSIGAKKEVLKIEHCSIAFCWIIEVIKQWFYQACGIS